MGLCADIYLLQRTYQYFGGGALNRPFALTELPQYSIFVGQSLLYASWFYFLAISCLHFLLWRPLKLSALQAGYATLVVLLTGVLTITVVKWQVYTYFRHKFDVAILKELVDGKLTGMFAYVTPEQFLGFVAALAFLAANVFVVAWLRRFSDVAVWKPGRRSVIGLFMIGCLIVANHFWSRSESLHYGLSRQIPYWSVDQVLRKLTDFDRDGFGPLTLPPDPDNHNAAVNLYAIDIPGNGVDENGLFGDASVPPQVRALPTLRLGVEKNVVVVVVETFRTDVVLMELDGKPVMPFLGELARREAFSEKLYSNYGVTSRAIQSMFFGSLHYRRGDPQLFRLFEEVGYQTYVVSAHNEYWGDNFGLLEMSRIDKFFDANSIQWSERDLTTWQKMHPDYLVIGWQEVNSKVNESLAGHDDDPFLLYINYQDLHYPYYLEEMESVFIKRGRKDASFFRSDNREAILRQYANAAHHLDKAFQDLFRILEEHGALEDAVIVIVGDHPDSFYENGLLGHAWTVDESQRATPLIVVNGRGEFSEPLGQEELLSIVIHSVNGQGEKLRFKENAGKQVMVLTGTLERPRQIAWIAPERLITYDFKTHRAQIGAESPWLRLSDLGSNHAEVESLVRNWEQHLWRRQD